MSRGKYILVNGSFILTENYSISLDESLGFLFSEKIRAVRTSFPFFKETLGLIHKKMHLFGHSFPEFTNNGGAGLKRQLERTLTKNKLFLGALFTISFRYSGEKVNYSILAEKLDNPDFELNEKGLYIDVFDEILKPASGISDSAVGSELFWKIAQNQLTHPMTDHFIILNTNQRVADLDESNLYAIKGRQVKGTGINEAAFQDISKPVMIEIFNRLDLNYTEEQGITVSDLMESDEILIVNTLSGIRWVVGFKGKRYYSTTIRRIGDLFKQIVSVK